MIRVAFLCMLLPVLFSVAARAQKAGEGAPVVDIVFEGNFRVHPSLIRDNIKTRVGLPYSSETAGKDIDLIFEKFGLKAQFEPVPVEGGYRVIITLSEDLRIREKVIRGLDEDEADEVWELLGLDRNSFPSRYLLKADAQKIGDHFRDDGYYFVEVRPILERVRDGARLVYEVYKGEKVTVDEINFIGLKKVDDGDLRSEMETDEPTLWIFTDKLKIDVLNQDISRLNTYLSDEGYLDARVTLDSIEFNDDYDEARINILVREGERFNVRSVEVEGARVFHPDQIKELINTRPGEPYRGSRVFADKRRIERFYRDRGYIRCRILGPDMRYDEQEPLVDLTYIIEEGTQKTLRDVVITGNAVTRDKVIRRKIYLNTGEIFDHSELRWSINELLNLNFFTDSTGKLLLDVHNEETQEPQLEDLVVNVGEEGTGFFLFTVGVNTDTGLIGGVKIDKRNFDLFDPPSSIWALPGEFFGNHHAFHGGGQNLVFSVMPGTVESSYSISFLEPYLFDTQPYPVSLGLDFYRDLLELSDYTERRQGIRPLLGKQWTRKLYTSIGARSELINLYHLDDDAPQDYKDFKGKNGYRGLEGRISYSDVDNPRTPTSGYTSFLSYEYSGGVLGADVELSKAVGSATLYLPVYETEAGHHHVLSLKGTYGWVEAHSGMDRVPIFERFFAGGASGFFPIRGFKWREVGPRSEGDAIGGNGAMGLTAEYSIPLVSEYNRELDVEDTRLKGVFFFDAGNVAKDVHERELYHRMRTSCGVGLKFSLPVLGGVPVAIYYGVPLKKFPGDERRSLNLSLSSVF